MATNSTSLETARVAKEHARERLRRLPGFAGVGLARHGEGYAVKLNLSEDRGGPIPDQVDGVPVVVEIVGRVAKQGR